MHARWFLLLLLAAALASCQMGSTGPGYGGYTSGGGTGSMGSNASVAIYDTYLLPTSVTIAAGYMVSWYNYGASSHSVVSTSGPVSFSSGTIAPAGAYSFTFTTAGSYSYSGPGGTGTITVTP